MGAISLGGGSIGVQDESFKGFWNANTNSPDYNVILVNTDDYLIVSVAGTQTLPGLGSVSFAVGNFLVKTLTSFEIIRETMPLFNLADGTIPMVTSGVLEASSLSELTDLVMASKTIRTEAGTIEIGPGVDLSEIGSEIALRSNASGNQYVPVSYAITQPTQFVTRNRPFYGRIATEETDFLIQSDDSTSTTITTYNFVPTFDVQQNVFSLNFVNAVTDFRVRVTSLTTNEVVKYFPSQMDWDNDTGLDFNTGVQEVFRRNEIVSGVTQPPFRYFDGITYQIEYRANETVVLLGDGTTPWIQADIQRLEIKTLLDEDDSLQVQSAGSDIGSPSTTLNIVSGATVVDNSGVIDVTIPAFVPADHSVTEFNDVTDAGSGAIITATERGNIRTDEQFFEELKPLLIAGTAITFDVDDTNNTITINVGGGMPLPQADSTNYLALTSDNLAATVDTGTALSSDDLNPSFTIPVFTQNSYLQILQSMEHSEFSFINIAGINQKGIFTINNNARLISGQQYRQYVSTNLLTSAFDNQPVVTGGAS